jgi:hypothetical protein
MNPQPEQIHTKETTVVLQDAGLRKLKGFVQIPKAILLCQDISYGAKVAYSILLGYAWQDEFCFPAQESLANDLGCSIRQARRFLVELHEHRFISWKQTGLNKPNVYYLLPLPPLEKGSEAAKKVLKHKDGTNMSHPDRTDLAEPDGTSMSGQDKTNMSAYIYSSTNTKNNVNVDREGKGRKGPEDPRTDLHKLPTLDQDKAKTDLIASDILHQLGDRQSLPFYHLVAARVPEQEIYAVLASIKQNGANYPPRVFVSRMKDYAAKKVNGHGQTLHLAMDDLRNRMTLR